MRHEVIKVRHVLPCGYLEGLRHDSRYPTLDHCETIIGGEDTDVLKPDGSPLLKLRTNAIPADVCEEARPALRDAGSGYSEKRLLYSNIVGYFDEPNCRLTAYTANNLDNYGQSLPFIEAVNLVYQREYRAKWSVQRKVAHATNRAFVIGRTAFTTFTVNLWDETHDARTPVHIDRGDLQEGFGVISVLSSGNYTGGLLVFPKYRVGVDLRTTDVLLCDVHEHHGNTAVVPVPGWERISVICYYRTKMQHC